MKRLDVLKFWTTYQELKDEILDALNWKSDRYYPLHEFTMDIVDYSDVEDGEEEILPLTEEQLTKERLDKFINENVFRDEDVKELENDIMEMFNYKHKYLEYKVLSQILYEFYPVEVRKEILDELLIHKEDGDLLEKFVEIVKKEQLTELVTQ